MASPDSDKAVDDLVAAYSPEVQDLVLATRTFVHKMIPSALELYKSLPVENQVFGYSCRCVDQGLTSEFE